MVKNNDGFILRNLTYFNQEIEDIEAKLATAVTNIVTNKEKSQYSRLATDAQWHIRGLIYHFRNSLEAYQKICEQIALRAIQPYRPDVMLFHSPEVQQLLFEFNSLVTLARTTLDHTTQHTLSPFFKPGVLPGSFNTFLKGKSNISIHDDLNDEPIVRYLIDLRDCMVHFRTIASADSTLAFSDGVDINNLPDISSVWKQPIVRTHYRLVDKNKISVNLLLPDAIYVYTDDGTRGGLVQGFTYNSRNSILRYSISFIQICAAYSVALLNALYEDDSQKYQWRRK